MTFKVGDRVRVIKNGESYTTHGDCAEDMRLRNWARGRLLDDGTEAVVVRTPSTKYPDICAIMVDGKEYLIGLSGLEILTNPDGTPWVNPGWTCTCGSCKKPMPAVGRGACTCIPRRDDGTWDWGKAAKIEETEPKFKVGDKGRDPDCLRGITGITDFGGLYVSNGGYLKSITQLMREEGTINKPKMNVIKALKANLTPTDRKLVKHGYLTSKGERTDFYESELREAALSKLIEAEDTPEFRKELADALKCDDEE